MFDYQQLNDMVYIACWGGSACLFLQYSLHAYTVFCDKTGKIYILTVLGLILCFLESCLTLVNVYFNPTDSQKQPELTDASLHWYLINIPMNVVWFFMVQIVTWLYVLRIESLGYYFKFDKYLKYAPFLIAVMQMPTVVINLERSKVDDDSYQYFMIFSSAFSIIITLVELYMFVILLRKLNFILEYKPIILTKMGKHLKISCFAVMILEITMAVVRFFFLIDFSISPLIYLLRIYIIIQFYSDLLVSINRESKVTTDLRLNSYLEPFDSSQFF
eukprot:NODE_346_length_10492_cov_0.275955.p5 type:complete len:274 gc:universal NODE_346_length_10492_cov_0.275955:9899-9078(-)